MKRLLVIALLVAGCANSQPAARPGSQAVYDRIVVMTDCAALQGEFDTAAGNHDRAAPGSAAAIVSTSYMVVANDRMRAVGC